MKDLSEDFAAKKATLEDNKWVMLMEIIAKQPPGM